MRVLSPLFAAAWLTAAAAVLITSPTREDIGYGVIADCHRPVGATVATFVVAALGALVVAAPSVLLGRRAERRALLIAAVLLVAWGVMTFAWLPHLDRICEN
jgi:MFS family permease